MRITLLAVGRLRQYYRDACDDYLGRLKHYDTVVEQELRELHAPTVERHRELESVALSERIPAGSRRVVLDRSGVQWSSEALAAEVQRWREAGRPVTVIIGGSDGVSPAFVGEADAVWSLGPMTLPHELARVVVVEQLYRACTILRGEKYHK